MREKEKETESDKEKRESVCPSQMENVRNGGCAPPSLRQIEKDLNASSVLLSPCPLEEALKAAQCHSP